MLEGFIVTACVPVFMIHGCGWGTITLQVHLYGNGNVHVLKSTYLSK